MKRKMLISIPISIIIIISTLTCCITTAETKSIDYPTAIAVSNENPFYALIATPVAVHYDDYNNQEVIPLYIVDFDNPSKSVERAEVQIGRNIDYVIGNTGSLKEISIDVATTFWESSSYMLIIKNDSTGYNLGVAATPLASYLNMPVIVTDEIDNDIINLIEDLGVKNVYICGDFGSSRLSFIIKFDTVDEIIDECIDVIDDKFDHDVNYITMTNPLDVSMPDIIDTTIYNFNGTVNSGVFLPTQTINLLTKGNTVTHHNFSIPADYKHTTLKIDFTNINSENVDSLGDGCSVIVKAPDGEMYVLASTGGGLPIRDGNGSITEDRIHFETTIYNRTGNYTLSISGKWFAANSGDYTATITLDHIENSIVPLMPRLSTIAPYLTAYHKGIIFAKPEFAFAASDGVIYNGTTCPGLSQPGGNSNLMVPSNEHTMNIHDELVEMLSDIADIPVENLEQLQNHYSNNPVYIAIVADPTMVPMYFYYNPDGKPDSNSYAFGFGVASDFIYGDIDPIPSDPENNTYTYWPFQENIVGRVTGRDSQDCSALIARTIFYNEIIDDMGNWKNNALVQTGCGLEFQNLPLITRLSQLVYQGRGDPTKFPTGESKFINLKLTEDMKTGGYTTKSSRGTETQREGFSDDDLDKIKNFGYMNKLLFTKSIVKMVSSSENVTGGEDQLNSSFIFTFAHGFYNLYEAGDVLMDSVGFPFVTQLTRIHPGIRSGLSGKGSFNVRSVENMEYGPSVIYVQSCITGRTDGIRGENTLSQTYIHAGVNAFIGATRVTADPGYLEPRPLPGGLGFGILGYLKATIELALFDKYPEMHFGAVIAEDFILGLTENNATTGRALRDAKNMYLPKDANSTFLWTPPLKNVGIFGNDRDQTLDKKYVALHEFTLYGDPAFNPYQPINNG